MILRILTISFLSFFALSAGAQKEDRSEQRKEKKEMLEAQKIAFITSEISLTPEEAQTFWPVYNEYNAERNGLHEEKRTATKNVNISDMSDSEADQYVENLLRIETDELAIKKEYTLKLKKILPSKKIAKLFKVEKLFKSRIMDKLKRRMNRKDRHR